MPQHFKHCRAQVKHLGNSMPNTGLKGTESRGFFTGIFHTYNFRMGFDQPNKLLLQIVLF